MDVFRFIRVKSATPDIRAEILRDYRHIVLLQVCIILSALVSGPALSLAIEDVSIATQVRDSIFLVFGALYVYILWDFLRNLTKSQLFVTALFVLIMGSYLLTLYTINPFIEFVEGESNKRPLLFFIHSVLFSVEAVVIYYTILELFKGEKTLEERLWGSACVYLMIGICFGSIYDLICIADPGALGMQIELGLDSYLTCIRESMNIIGGRDALGNASPLLQGVASVEAVWANLFVVLLVGRLLSQPSSKS